MLEKEIEDIIYQGCKESPDQMIERGFILPKNPLVFQQLTIGEYGIPDLVAIGNNEKEKTWEICIYELKRTNVSYSNLSQLTQYMGGIYDWITQTNSIPLEIFDKNIKVSGILVAPEINAGLPGWLGPNIHFLSVEYSPFKGIQFKDHSKFLYYGNQKVNNIDITVPEYINTLTDHYKKENVSA